MLTFITVLIIVGLTIWVQIPEGQEDSKEQTIFEQSYDGESIVDSFRDIPEAFNAGYNDLVLDIPTDEHGFMNGDFTITIKWNPKGGIQ